MKLNNFKKKYNLLIYIIFIIIFFFCIYNYLNIIEPYRKSKSRNSNSNSNSNNGKCIARNSCNENETILYKCLNKTDIEDNNEFHTYRICKDSNKKNSKEAYKCKIDDKCDDNNILSYTCIDEDDDDIIETSKTNGWSKNKKLGHHKSCNENYLFSCLIQ